MRIGIDIRSVLSTKTGIGHYTNCLCENLAKIDKKHTYDLFYFNFRNKKIEIDLNAPGLNKEAIRSIPGRLCLFLWRYLNYPKGSWLIKKKDLVHFPNFTIMPGIKGKVVITVHDLSFIRYPQFTDPVNLKFLKKNFPKSLQRADHIITVSEFSKQEILDIYNVDSSDVTVVSLGVDDRFKKTYASEDIQVVKEKYKTGDQYILSLGTLEPRKNIPTLIAAFDSICQQCPERKLKLVLTGKKGWLYEEIFDLVSDRETKKNIIFTGYILDDELPLIYQGSSLFVCPSFYEGFGLPVAEAMASGVPVIASTAESLVEVGRDAIVTFDPNNIGELTTTICELLDDETKRNILIEKGKQRATDFCWKKTAQKTLDVYKSLLE